MMMRPNGNGSLAAGASTSFGFIAMKNGTQRPGTSPYDGAPFTPAQAFCP